MSLGNDSMPMLTMPVEPAGTSNSGNNGNGMWGGDGWWVIVLFLIWGMWGGNWGNGGFGGGGNAATQGALTREQACIDNNFQNLMRETAGISDAVNAGFNTLDTRVCQQSYETAGLINGLSNTVQSGFNAMNISNLQTANAQNIANLQSTNAIQSQMAGCCCDIREGISGVNYNLSTQACDTRNVIQNTTRDMIDNANANTRAILDKLNQQEMAAKDAQIAAQNQQIFALQLAQSQGQQTAQIEARADARLNQVLHAINPPAVPAYPAPNPCGYNWSPNVLAGGFGYNNGCGGCNC